MGAAGLFDLEGRVAAVTGGGGGIGAVIGAGLAEAGADVVLLDRDESVAETAAGIGEAASALVVDVTSRTELERAAAAVLERRGRVDILVNSAGVTFRSPAEDFPEEALDRVLAVNLKGTFLACQAFGREMLAAGRGSIVNLASIGAFVAYPYSSAYLASKGGVLQLTRGLALEWIDRGVRVNAIAPGLMDTGLIERADEADTTTSDFIEARFLRDGGRRLPPAELVGAAIFLASDASARVTGHTLPVDDGYLAV
ncbi:MAG: SDR family oxidoreductase [Actinobacteria bacterium]|nr:SDR family oxidoreductase [Actinomycetota bacterium]